MSTLNISKSWQFNVNNVNTYVSSRNNAFGPMFLMKEVMIGDGYFTDSDGNSITANSNWTVVGSSGGGLGGGGGMDGYDRWVVESDLDSNSPSQGAWMVLENSVLGMQILFGLPKTNYSYDSYLHTNMRAYLSYVGFTGGNSNTFPTATDIVNIGTSSTFDTRSVLGTTTAVTNTVIHYMQTDDGYHSRMLVMAYGAVRALWSFEKLSDSNALWDNNSICRLSNTNPTYGGLTNYYYFGTLNGVNSSFGLTGEKDFETSTDLLPAVLGTVNEISGYYSIYPMGVAREGAYMGKYGNMVDMWWGSSDVPNYSSYPGDESRQFIQFDDMILPWNKSAIVTV